MSFVSAVARRIIRQECHQRYGLKFVRLLSKSAAGETQSGKTEDTRRYVPRSVFCDLCTLQSCFKPLCLQIAYLLSVRTTNVSNMVVKILSKVKVLCIASSFLVIIV